MLYFLSIPSRMLPCEVYSRHAKVYKNFQFLLGCFEQGSVKQSNGKKDDVSIPSRMLQDKTILVHNEHGIVFQFLLGCFRTKPY